jgi:cation:H+ antiporter
MLVAGLLLITGFIVLIYGADTLVKGARLLASSLGVSDLVIGLTVVAFGTSLPELTINAFNSFKGANDAVFGNVIGSNICNLLLILGVAGMIYPIKVQRQSVAYEVPFSLALAVVLFLLVNDRVLTGNENQLGVYGALILLALFGLFMFYISRIPSEGENDTPDNRQVPVFRSALLIVLGVAGLVGGGYLITDNATKIAVFLGMSEKLIALTVLSLGTSAPELATSAVAASRKSADIAVGNIIGSNVFNITLILGVSALINPINYNPILNQDLYVLSAGTLFLLLAMYTGKKLSLDRWEAAILLLAYVGYTLYIVFRN